MKFVIGMFYVIIDEAHDESNKEQMTITLRFIDKISFKRDFFSLFML